MNLRKAIDIALFHQYGEGSVEKNPTQRVGLGQDELVIRISSQFTNVQLSP